MSDNIGERTAPPDEQPAPPAPPRITTIVGGRPPTEESRPTGLPAGIEQVLTLAALDPQFREALARDRAAALDAYGISLTPSEAGILAVIPAPELERTIDQVLAPRVTRRGFIKSASASVAAMLGAGAALVAGGCPQTKGHRADSELRTWGHSAHQPMSAGADASQPREHVATLGKRPAGGTRGIQPDVPAGGYGAGDYWVTLAGLPCFLYLPPGYKAGQRVSVLLHLHNKGQTALDAVKTWRPIAETRHFALVAPRWPATPEGASPFDTSVPLMLDDLAADYHVAAGTAVVAGFGAGAGAALGAVLANKTGPSGAIAVSGGLGKGWENRPLQGAPRSALFFWVAEGDPERDRLTAQAKALEQRGARVKLVAASARTPVVDVLRDAWDWVTTPSKPAGGL